MIPSDLNTTFLYHKVKIFSDPCCVRVNWESGSTPRRIDLSSHLHRRVHFHTTWKRTCLFYYEGEGKQTEQVIDETRGSVFCSWHNPRLRHGVFAIRTISFTRVPRACSLPLSFSRLTSLLRFLLSRLFFFSWSFEGKVVAFLESGRSRTQLHFEFGTRTT